MPSAQEVYADTVSTMPRGERIRLAALILDDIAQAPDLDDWSGQDLEEVTSYALRYAAEAYGPEENVA